MEEFDEEEFLSHFSYEQQNYLRSLPEKVEVKYPEERIRSQDLQNENEVKRIYRLAQLCCKKAGLPNLKILLDHKKVKSQVTGEEHERYGRKIYIRKGDVVVELERDKRYWAFELVGCLKCLFIEGYHPSQAELNTTICNLVSGIYTGCNLMRHLTHKYNIEGIAIPPVDRIANGAFANCDKLATISFTSLPVDIGDYAFIGCQPKLINIGGQTTNIIRSSTGCIVYSNDHTFLETLRKSEPFVDLGLPSGNLWATNDLSKRGGRWGDHFAYGEIVPRKGPEPSGYEHLEKRDFQLTASSDIATVLLGTEWQTPTEADFKELFQYCQATISNREIVLTGPNGNRLYFHKPTIRCNTYWTHNNKCMLLFEKSQVYRNLDVTQVGLIRAVKHRK